MKKLFVRASSWIFMVAAGIALAPAAAMAIPDICAGNLVTNCGFEGGVYSSTLDGQTNTEVPNGWTPNAAFDSGLFYQGAQMGTVHSGAYALQIANDDGQAVPALSQTISDTVGQAYKETFYLSYGGAGVGDTAAFFDAQLNTATKLSFDDTTPGNFAAYSFNFTGTGTDTLTFTGNTTPSYWYLDDVSVTAVPEPPTTWLLLAGIGALGIWLRTRPTGSLRYPVPRGRAFSPRR